MAGTSPPQHRLRRLLLLGAVLVGGLTAAVPAASAAPTPTVDLGTASTYAALGSASVGNTVSAEGAPGTTLHGDLGVKANALPTGFPPGRVTGASRVGTPAASQAHADASAAYAEVAGRAGGTTLAAALAGTTVGPGLHTIVGAASNTTTVTLDAGGDPDAVFVFQVGGAFAAAAGSQVVLADGARASNVFWQVNGAAAIGATASFAGTVLANTTVAVGNGTVVNGRLVALGGALTLDANEVFSGPPAVTIAGGAAAITTDTTPTISGTTDLEAPGKVMVTVAGETSAVTPSAGAWSITTPLLANATYPVVASVTDGAGNTSTATQQLTVDTVLPLVTIDGGASAATADPTPTISGTSDVAAGSVVRVTAGAQARSAVVDADGTWNVTPSRLDDGPVTVTATVTDPAGNDGTAGQVLTVDTTAPALAIAGGATALTNDRTPVLAGTAGVPAGTAVTVTLADETLTAITDDGGAWAVEASALTDGPHRVLVGVSDAVGNPAGTTQQLTVDTVAPAVAISGGAAAGTQDESPTISGTSDAAPGTTVTVTIAGQTRTTLVQDGGTWNATPDAVGPGAFAVTAAVPDPAGNVGRATQALTIGPAAADPVVPGPPAATPTAPAPVATATPTPSPAATPAPSPAPPVAVPPSGAARATLAGGVLRTTVSVACPKAAKGPCSGSIAVSAKPTPKAKRVRIGTSRFEVAPGKRARVAVTLNARGKRLLRRATTVKATLLMTTRDATGRVVRKTTRVTIRLAR